MRAGLFLFFAALAVTATPAAARPNHVREHVHAGEIEPLDRILPHIRRAHPGTFYDAEGPVLGPDGRYTYRLKWMTPQGRIIWLDTDARTGRVMGIRGGRRPVEQAPGSVHFAPGQYLPPGRYYSAPYGPAPGWRGRMMPPRGWAGGPRGGRRHGGRHGRPGGFP